MPANPLPTVFVVLLRDRGVAQRMVEMLAFATRPDGETACLVLVPPKRGLEFFRDASSELDEWWAENITGDGEIVYVLEHEEGIAAQLMDPAAHFVVSIPTGYGAHEYPSSPSISIVEAESLEDVASVLVDTFPRVLAVPPGTADQDGRSEKASSGADGSADGLDSDLFARPSDAPFGKNVQRPRPRPPAPPLIGAGAGGAGIATPQVHYVASPGAHPLELLANMETSNVDVAAPATRVDSPSGSLDRRDLISTLAAPGKGAPITRGPRVALERFKELVNRGGSGAAPERWRSPPPELVDLLQRNQPIIIAFGSKKGGVGKTANAAGVAEMLGELADRAATTAAFVDANLTNPDAWDGFPLPENAATVASAIATIMAGALPDAPVMADSPSLAIYPEIRASGGYSREEIHRFADYLKRRYSAIVVDLSNREPSLTAGPEAEAVQFWMQLADVLVLPMQTNKADFRGVREFLEIPNLPSTIVAYIETSHAKTRRLPDVTAFVDEELPEKVEVVRIPDDDRQRYAAFTGISASSISKELAASYQLLTERILLRVAATNERER